MGVLVAGLALGVDGAAHKGALRGGTNQAHWHTVAVVGTGLDRVYPRQHQALAGQMALQGLLLSEFDLGTPPLRENFQKGLSEGKVVTCLLIQALLCLLLRRRPAVCSTGGGAMLAESSLV